ncbi:MAG: hypothetical protein NW223_10475 [Hyphomicrobiaceae bacterium]|nr:hypothetical protein [Hyphomicrobiaceae bacterium]
MMQERRALILAALVAACLGAGASYAYSHLAGQPAAPTDCDCRERRSDRVQGQGLEREVETHGAHADTDYSWRRWPSLVDF